MIQFTALTFKFHCRTIRRIGLALAVLVSLSATRDASAADEFVIKFDELGYDNAPADLEEPELKLFRSIEVLATIDSRFAVRVVRPRETIIVRGTLKHGEDGYFIVAFRHSVLWPQEGTTRVGQTTSESSVNMRLDQRTNIGGIITKIKETQSNTKTNETQSKRWLTITVTKPVTDW